MSDSPFRAPRVTTVATRTKIHAVDTHRASTPDVGTVRVVCGTVLARHAWLMLRSSPTADAYVTCKRCAARLADGITVSADTVRRARLASQLTDDLPPYYGRPIDTPDGHRWAGSCTSTCAACRAGYQH